MPDDPTFTIVDTSGNTLHFDSFSYESPVEKRGEYYDNWLLCRITLQARIEPFNAENIFTRSVNAQFLTTELTALSEALGAGLSSPPGAESMFEPMEPYIELRIERLEKNVLVTARLDLAPANGPVIEFSYVCRPEEIQATLDGIERVKEAFPERKSP